MDIRIQRLLRKALREAVRDNQKDIAMYCRRQLGLVA